MALVSAPCCRSGYTKAQKDATRAGVELHAGAPLKLRCSLLEAERRAPGSGLRHRDECVTDRDQARTERDLLFGEAVGVSAPVPALVSRADQLRDGRHRRCRRKDALTDQRVIAHDLPLAGVQRPLLVQDRVGHGNLADVVELRGARDLVKLLGVEMDRVAELDRELGDASQVTVELRLPLA